MKSNCKHCIWFFFLTCQGQNGPHTHCWYHVPHLFIITSFSLKSEYITEEMDCCEMFISKVLFTKCLIIWLLVDNDLNRAIF